METPRLPEVLQAILGLSGGEFILLVVVFLVSFFARRGLERGVKDFLRAFRESGRGIGESVGADFGKPVADALTHSNRTCEFQDPPALRLLRIKKQMKNHFILWIAQGFGAGRIRFAPGTFGSLVGLLWLVVLLWPANLWIYAGGMGAGIFLSVWLCGAAEKILHQTDPGSVVLDEIVAMPICFAVWVGNVFLETGAMPSAHYFFNGHTWPLTLAVFAAFRFFDVVKPWPVRQSQKLPRGWGVAVDDVLAALYVNVLTALALSIPLGR